MALQQITSNDITSVANTIITGQITSTQLDVISANGSGAIIVPVGNTAQRPTVTTAGAIRFNTTLGSLESANGTAWANVGSGAASSGGGVSWQPVQNTSFIAVAGSGYGVNTAIANVTVTLPASPTVGQQIQIVDYARTFSSNNLIVFPNGNRIQGNTANLIISTNGQSAAFVYYDANQGWLPYSSGFALGPYFVNYLIVAGGGGSGGPSGGGAGAGGVLSGAAISVTPGTQYSVTVGSGGAIGSAGLNSSIFGFNGIGGGRGGDVNNNNSGAGGSGGGGGRTSTVATPGNSGTVGQGNPGGAGNTTSPYPSGGGGGAGASGGTPGTGASASGAGGIGVTNSISGSSVYYAGGGGGSGDGSTNTAGAGGTGGGGAGGFAIAGSAGSSNTGGGGGSGGGGGAAGGSGVVIISYTGPVRGTGGIISSSGGQTIHTFTSSGTYIA